MRRWLSGAPHLVAAIQPPFCNAGRIVPLAQRNAFPLSFATIAGLPPPSDARHPDEIMPVM
jgi:hypothetical protein